MGLDIVGAFMAIEEAFGIEVPDAEASRMGTVGSLFEYVRAHVEPQLDPDAGQYAGPLWERYLDVLEQETGVQRNQLRPTPIGSATLVLTSRPSLQNRQGSRPRWRHIVSP